jgi:hypothetical protein
MRNSDVSVGITNTIWNRSLMMLLGCRTILSFQLVCKSHANYLKLASSGRGCNRHMLGLQMMLRDGEQHAVFAMTHLN